MKWWQGREAGRPAPPAGAEQRRVPAPPGRRSRPRLFETGGDRYEAEREQWDDGDTELGRGRPRCMSCPIERDVVASDS